LYIEERQGVRIPDALISHSPVSGSRIAGCTFPFSGC
jgi:hypothetical protein